MRIRESISAISIQTTRPVHRQIADQLRDRLISDAFPAGSRLPSTQALAAIWKIAPLTVHRGLNLLVKEGLLVRSPRRGTFVCDREKRLMHVGIYHAEDIWSESSSAFQQVIHKAVKQLLSKHKIATDVWIDPRPWRQQKTAWPALVSAAENRKIQALIVTTTDWPHWRWLNKLPVPAAFCCSADLPNAVSSDMAQFVELGVGALADQGCRSVGFICPMPTARTDAEGMPNPYAMLFDYFVEACHERRLEVRNEWVFPKTPDLLGKSDEQQGYELFYRLWRQPRRPQGLLMTTDIHARGAIAAALELRVCVPGELKLAFHKNARVELFCPFPASFVVFDEEAMARALVETVEKQFRGEEVRRKPIGYTLAKHPGAAQSHSHH